MAFFNDKSQTKLRQKLKKYASPIERILWSKLKGKQLNGYKFRRQYGVGKYVVDFYCPALKLAIELDGNSHFETELAVQYDQERQKFIESAGIHFLRFQNDEIIHNLDGVLTTILKRLPPQ